MSSIRINRARCALYKKILDLLDEESVSGESSGRASSPAAEVGNPASLDKVFFLLIISLWDTCNNIQVGVEFLPLGN